MSQTHDHRADATYKAAGKPAEIAEDPGLLDLLALMDDPSPEALMMAQGLTGNTFSLALLAGAAQMGEMALEDASTAAPTAAQDAQPEEASEDGLMALGARFAGAVLGSTVGGAVLGPAGALLGGWLGGPLLASLVGGPESQQGQLPPTAQAPAEEEPALDATPLPTKEQTREALITSYQTWLEARTAELADLSGEEKARRIEGLLDQAGRVYAQLEQGQTVDIDQLDTAPSSKGATHIAGTAPPELIGLMRALISQVEVDIDGATADGYAAAETSRTSGVDWNARLGVPQFRNQNDNVVASYVTCNVTSGAMVLERLGYGREDVKAATQQELTEAWIIEQKAAWKDANGVDMPAEQEASLRQQGPSAEWVQGRIAAYFEEAEDEAENGSDYRQMRSGTDPDLTGATHEEAREVVAGQFMESAQTEEMLDLLMQLHHDNGGFTEIGADADLGTVRRSIAAEGVADELLGLIDPATAEAGTRTGCEQVSVSWADAKPLIKTCLEQGGAAQMSVMHKVQRSEGHLVSVQQITAGGVVIDDPYGLIGASYDHDSTNPAYDGKSAYKGTFSGSTNQVDPQESGVVDDDWTWEQGQQLRPEEQAGMSHTLPDSQISAMFKYATLFHRPAKS